MKNFKKSLLLVILISFPILATWTSFTKDDILIDNDNFVGLEMDLYNPTYLWGITDGSGIVKYNGNDFENFRQLFGDIINDNVKTLCMCADSLGYLWLGTANGISVMDRNELWTEYSSSDGLSSNYIISMASDTNSNIWVGTADSGICFFDTAWSTFDTSDGLINMTVNAIEVDKQNKVWFATDSGISSFDGSVWTSYTEADGMCNNSIKAILIDDDTTVWFATENGISHFDGTTWTTVNNPDSFGENIFYDIQKDKFGFYWFASLKGGIKKFDGNNFLKTYTIDNGLINNNATSIAIDSNNVKWFGTAAGLSRFINDVPVLTLIDSLDTIYVGSAYKINFSVSDTNDDSLDINIVNATAGITLDADSSYISWTPILSDVGTHSFSVVVNDLNGGYDTISIVLTVPSIPANINKDELFSNVSKLFSPTPNPFNPSTQIKYSIINDKSYVNISVYNLKGILVKELVNTYMNKGINSVNWRGVDNNNKKVSSGIYIVSLKSNNIINNKRVIFNK